ncbi:hypothetical protein AAC387_Pa12g1337 [Persea americana]
MRAAVKLQLRASLHSERRKTGKSTLPPMRAAVKLQLPVFLLSQRRKTGNSSLPPTRAAVKLQLPVFLHKTGKCEMRAAVQPSFRGTEPRPMTRQQAKEGKKRKKNRIERFPPYVPAAHMQFPVFLLSRSIYAISSFPPLREEENWKIDFTAYESSGKAAIASFPALREEENWNINFTAYESSGKAAAASFPPLSEEENWKLKFTADESSGKAATACFPPQNWKMRDASSGRAACVSK